MDKMMQKLLWVTGLLGLGLGVALSFGQPKNDRPGEEAPQQVQRFGALSLKGELKRPELSFDRDKLGFDQDSHLETPENFYDDILNEANRLKP
jgi:hypothetical protein